MTKVSLSNGNETKSDIFPWNIFKSDGISFLSKHIKVFQWLSKSKFFNCMTKVNPNNGNEIKPDIFPMDVLSRSDTIFIVCKILKYFNDFYNWHCSISLQKWTQSNKVKWNHTGHVQMWQYFAFSIKSCYAFKVSF